MALAALAGIAGFTATHSAIAGHKPEKAQDARSLTVDVGDCVDLKSRRARLACYEKHVDAAQRERGAAAPVAQAASSRADSEAGDTAAASAAHRDAQVSVAPARERAVAARARAETKEVASQARDADESVAVEKGQAKDASEIVSTIKALRQTVPNSYLITLENGQVWRQMRPERYELRVGQRVRLYSVPRWGSAYRLTVEKLRGFIQVERVR